MSETEATVEDDAREMENEHGRKAETDRDERETSIDNDGRRNETEHNREMKDTDRQRRGRGPTRGSTHDRTREQYRVDRGEWALFAVLALAGTGLLLGAQVLVAAATVPLCYVAAAVFRTRQDLSVRMHRTFHTATSADGGVPVATESDTADTTLTSGPGDTITVRTTVENASDASLVDLRVVDGVPGALPVVDGTPRLATTLEPGATATLEYDVELRRGEHEFGAAAIRARDLTGTVAATRTKSVAGGTRMRCWPTVADVPLTSGIDEYAGEVPTNESGSGVEFHSVREYAAGDPARSIDWRRYGRTRELATVEYRAERTARVVCVVDDRTSQRRASVVSELSAAELSASAAERTSESLLDAGYPTGLATLHVRRVFGVSPGTSAETRRRVTGHLQNVRTQQTSKADWIQSLFGSPVETLPRVLPGEAQVVFFSSFVDDDALAVVERLRTVGYEVRVVSPDVMGSVVDSTDEKDETPNESGPTDTKRETGARLEALDRNARLAQARATGARVVDWDLERPIGLVLQETLAEVQPR
ncbi:hypothetical protein C482_00310 [Natrialba chahannaoensis JCM 10990]|uniref:DUF58 domain-containing protein n=1 Tax=Natrialba chahannaoensis JCM 10990 TaxID=1227492 RepID=M0B7G7_9EURY|nr:DUF58 domain-containing protein [Natrialba chahannaoensis]ELZ06218.1 hypothetical protein C482_00310 [Natrialba chahannaoensis JCM 10990]